MEPGEEGVEPEDRSGPWGPGPGRARTSTSAATDGSPMMSMFHW